MNFLNFLKNIPTEVITIFLLFGVPVIGRVLKKLADQAKKRREALQRERDELERLRTGRAPQREVAAPARVTAGPATSGASARATLEEMAAKRRAQIEQMRGQARPTPIAPPTARPQPQAQRSTPVTAPRAQTTTVHLPGGVVLELPVPKPQAPLRGPGRQAPVQRQRQQPAARQQAPQRRPQAAKPTISREQYERERQAAFQEQSRRQEEQVDEDRRRRVAAGVSSVEQVVQPVKRSTESAASRSGKAVLLGVAMSRTDWRRAFIMQELIGQPVGMRREMQGGIG